MNKQRTGVNKLVKKYFQKRIFLERVETYLKKIP